MEVEDGGKIKDFRASFGGMAPTTKSFTFASKVIGQEWNDATLEKIQLLISQEFKLPDNVPGGFAKYRSAMPNSFLIKFFFESRSALLGHQAKVRPNDSFDGLYEVGKIGVGKREIVFFEEKVSV